jgi:hypothetical protein
MCYRFAFSVVGSKPTCSAVSYWISTILKMKERFVSQLLTLFRNCVIELILSLPVVIKLANFVID